MDKPVISGDTIVVPSSTEHLADVDLFIEATLRGYGAQESVIADIAISVSELVNNAILHGNRSA
ncbi:MAG: ATP-binding protein, partial [candidate division Zixibacteria bacterium]|nr:ATP-binding protein [candidate division Zixibacteria bacterium]